VAGEADGEWSLYWALHGQHLDQREDAADIGPGHPILIDPEYRLDPMLALAGRGSRG
jgi:hypothetical protein